MAVGVALIAVIAQGLDRRIGVGEQVVDRELAVGGVDVVPEAPAAIAGKGAIAYLNADKGPVPRRAAVVGDAGDILDAVVPIRLVHRDQGADGNLGPFAECGLQVVVRVIEGDAVEFAIAGPDRRKKMPER